MSLHSQSVEKKDIRPAPQKQVNPAFIDDGREVTEPFNGTYRFIFTKGIKQIFTDEILKTIEINRKDIEDTILVLSPYARLQILSRRKIAEAGFVPYAKSYVFEYLNE